MPNFGLPDTTLTAIRHILADYPAVDKAILYGSRAKGNYRPGSDIDLTLMGDRLDLRILGEIAARLEESPIPYQVDLSLWNQLDHAKLREHIERVGVVFYQRRGIAEGKGGGGKAGWQSKTLVHLEESVMPAKAGIQRLVTGLPPSRERRERNYSKVSLGDVCQVIGGGTPSKDNAEYYTGDIPWATVRDMRSDVIYETECKITREAVKNSSTNIIPGNNVVIATRVGLGKVCLLGQNTAINQDLRGIVPNDPNKLAVRFLFWLLKSISDSIVAEGTGATVQGVKLPFVKGLQIPLPPLPEQQRIVGILDQAFDGIAIAKANAEKNLQNARALFASHLQAVFTQQGEGWVEKRLGDVCTLKSGMSVNTTLEKTAGDLPYIKVSDMTHAGNELEIVSSSRFLNVADIGRNAVFPLGTTIFPKRGGAILTNKKRLTAVPICADLNIMGVIPGKSIRPKYLYFYFLNVDMRSLGSGSSIPQINNYDIEPLLIAFPVSIDQQKDVVCKLEELSAETQRLEAIYRQKVAALEALKKSLLDQAFRGQL